MKRFLSFVRKEFYHVLRDRKTLLLLLGLPVAQIILFGFALTNEIKQSKTAILDLAQDEVSNRLTEQIAASDHFKIENILFSEADLERTFQEGKIKTAIIFPAKLASDLLHFNASEIQVIADASDPNTGKALSSYLSIIIQRHILNKAAQELPLSIQTEMRMIYNPELKGTTNFVPGVMALVLLLISVLMTSVSIVKEKELGTMEVLLVSPFNPLMVIVSKAFPYFFLSMVNLGITLLLSIYVLDMPMNGSLVLLITESAILIITALALGLLVSTVTKSQQTAMLVSLMVMMLPTMLFTGFMFPIENMPIPLQVISNIVPSKWYYIIVKGIMIKGVGLAELWQETLILLGMTAVLLIVSIKKFKIRLQ